MHGINQITNANLITCRLSCEKFFVLIPVFVSYLLFREPPPAVRALIRIISGTSQIFQKVSHAS